MARPRDESIDQAVIDACVALLGEVGRSGLSRAKIARRADVSLPAVNRRFASVDEILLAVASTPPSRAEPLGDANSLRSFLVESLIRTAKAISQPLVRRAASELLAAAAGDISIECAFDEALAEVRAEGLEWVERARSKGHIRHDVDGEALLDLATGALYYRLLWRGQIISEDEVVALVDVILDGAAPR